MNRALAVVLCGLMLLAAIPTARSDGGRTPDSDNTFDAATQLPGASGFVSESLDGADDKADFYKLEAKSGEIINASLFLHDYVASDPSQVNFDLFLYNPLREPVVNSTSIYRYESLKALAIAGGAFYIKVAWANGSGGYTLDYSVGPAQVVSNGMTISSYLTNSTNRPSDWYRVQLKGGQNADLFTAEMHEDATALFDLYFMDLWSGYSFWYDISWWSDPDERVEAVATYAGWYYLQVNAFKGYGAYKLNITVGSATGHAGSEPAGARQVAYNSTLSGRVDMAMEHYGWYRAELARDELMTATLRLDPQPADLFSLSVLRPDLTTLDSRTDYVVGTGGAQDSLARTVTLTKLAPSAGTYYFVVMAKVGLMEGNINNLADHNAASDYLLALNFSDHIPPPTNNPPFAKAPGVEAETDENSAYVLDLTTMFADPDGDTLEYTAKGTAHVGIELDSAAQRATFIPAHNWYGSENITVSAADPYDASATAWVDLKVRRVALPPEMLEKAPAADSLDGTNGTFLDFRVFAVDPEGAPLSYQWSANGVPLPGGFNFTGWKVPSDIGIVLIRAFISNGNLSVNADWRIACAPRPPLNVVIISPFNRTEVNEGERVRFYAMVTGLTASGTADLSFSWYLGDKKLYDGDQFSSDSLPAGTDIVEVRAVNRSESASSGRASVVVLVKQKEAGTDLVTMALIGGTVILAAVCGAALFVFSGRKRHSREVAERGAQRERGKRRRGMRARREMREKGRSI